MAKPGVILFEGNWSPDLRKRDSVRPLLQMVEQNANVETIYRDIGTVEEFLHYVSVWTTRIRYEHYRLGWFAFHGSPGAIHIGRKRYSLKDLGDALGPRALSGKIVFFGSCAVMEDRASIKAFRDLTKARAVCGYTKDVDWYEAAAFELLLLDAFTYRKTPDAAFKDLARKDKPLAIKLGFKSVPSWRPGT